MIYHRVIEDRINLLLPSREALILFGPRRVGKTTLLRRLEEQLKVSAPTAYFSLDDPGAQSIFRDFTIDRLATIFNGLGFTSQGRNYLLLDEILFFDGVDLLIKLIFDQFPQVKILATSSSSLLLMDSLTESLAGRKYFIELLPLTLAEILGLDEPDFFSFTGRPAQAPELSARTLEILNYGSYPEVVNLADHTEKRAKIKDLVDSALFKDLLLLEGIKNPRALTNLVSLLAHQVGSLVNTNEIATLLGISRRMVDEYIGLLEKFFVVFRLPPFGRNPRSEIGSKFKVYFHDLGIRNGIINRYEPVAGRDDRGALLENLIIAGIAKRNLYAGNPYRLFFWRNYSGYEVDLVLEAVEKKELVALEIKASGRGGVTRAFDKYAPHRKILAGLEDAYKYYL